MGVIYSPEELIEARSRWRQRGERVVFTNGCYDILHPGHIRLLEQARSLGDRLILALNSDHSVQRIKGPRRPLVAERDRAELASRLEAVDAIVLFDEETPRELIARVLPDILVKGGDYKAERAPGNAAEWRGGYKQGPALVVAAPPGYRSGVACLDGTPLACVAVGPGGVDAWDSSAWTPVSDTAGYDAIDLHGGAGWASGEHGRIARVSLAD